MLSKTMPLSLSRRLLEEHNKNNDDKDNSQLTSFSYSPQSYYSISPEPTFDSIVSEHSLHRRPTFTYIPIHKRRRSIMLSSPFNSMTMSMPNRNSLTSTLSSSSSSSSSSTQSTPESEMPTTPTSLCSSSSDQSVEYTSFPNLEKFADECWTEIRIERDNNTCDMEMESYDEMLVGGVRFQYT